MVAIFENLGPIKVKLRTIVGFSQKKLKLKERLKESVN